MLCFYRHFRRNREIFPPSGPSGHLLPREKAFHNKKGTPIGVPLPFAKSAAAAVVVAAVPVAGAAIAAAVAAEGAAAAATAIAQQQDQNDDPPPVVVQAAADTVIVAHKITSALFR